MARHSLATTCSLPMPTRSQHTTCRRGFCPAAIGYQLGYCHMGMFRTRDMFGLASLTAMEWVINFDSNLEIRRPMPYDPVSLLASRGHVFGMLSQTKRSHDAPDACYDGLHTAVQEYV